MASNLYGFSLNVGSLHDEVILAALDAIEDQLDIVDDEESLTYEEKRIQEAGRVLAGEAWVRSIFSAKSKKEDTVGT